MEAVFKKAVNNSLIPCDDDALGFVGKLKLGDDVRVKVTKARNIKFHRKFFVMLDYAYDCFEPEDVEVPQHMKQRGMIPEKNKERFRADMIILAGFSHATIRVNGDIQVEADSIAFGNMSEETFHELYSKVIDVVLKYVLTNFTEEELKNTVDGLMEFA